MNAHSTQIGDMPDSDLFASDPTLVACLVFVGGGRSGEAVVLGRDALAIGRAASNDIVLQDATVSRNHASVCIKDSSAVISDLGSTNGTYVNYQRVEEPRQLDPGAMVQIGGSTLRFTLRTRQDVDAAADAAADLDRAAHYVRAMLPERVERGPVIFDWEFEPCARLGGDVFGHRRIGRDGVIVYIIEVSDQGVNAAIHAAAIQAVLSQDVLPGVDLKSPTQVLSFLNRRFAMERHGGLSFTIWYGYYDIASRRLTYSSGGHHPGYLVSPDRHHMVALQVKNPRLGALSGQIFGSEVIDIPRSWSLYLFSDGAFEILDRNDRQWGITDFEQLIQGPGLIGPGEPARLLAELRKKARPGPMQDDCAILTLTFV